jgi:hypothetical protein
MIIKEVWSKKKQFSVYIGVFQNLRSGKNTQYVKENIGKTVYDIR